MNEQDLVARLRRLAQTRGSVQEGMPDALAELLEEAADEIERLRQLEVIEANPSETLAINEAIKVFGDQVKAREWLNQVNTVFGRTPMSMLDANDGLNEVMKVLSSIATGGVV